MNIFPRLLLSVALFVPALSLFVHAVETELSAAHGYVETTDGTVGASASICLAKRSTPAVVRR